MVDCASFAMASYGKYLKSVYRNSPISPERKWPPTPSKGYVTLATVESQERRYDYTVFALQGSIKKLLKQRRKVFMVDIFNPTIAWGCKKGEVRLVLVEGAPGIGKSTFVWELCKKWEEFPCMQQYKLVILLRLREEEVQAIGSVSELFYSYECEAELKKSLVAEVVQSQGSGILFILDGFDELPELLQKIGFLLNLIRGTVLPESTILVTSRPSATAELLTSCRAQIDKHIEILGFTQESVLKYATSIFASNKHQLEKFKTYISMSKNPAINSLMYIPLNAAIIAEIYRNCNSEDILPHTLTELYTQVCLTILKRYFNNPSLRILKFEDLPTDSHRHFLELSKLAFEGVRDRKLTFHMLPHKIVHFGFLDGVSALYGGGSVSYNFLHLTLQEFFAAYYISHLGKCGINLLREYGTQEHWNMVWRFVAGLTSFKPYEGCVEIEQCFRYEIDETGIIINDPFYVQCLFEAQRIDYLNFYSQQAELTFNVHQPCTAFDVYALGYCVSNFPVASMVRIVFDTIASFDVISSLPWGMRANTCVKWLSFENCMLTRCVAELKLYPWRNISTLCISNNCMLTNSDLIHLSELIPKMTSLKKLEISSDNYYNYYARDNRSSGFIKVLEQLSHSNVTVLNIAGSGYCSHVPTDMSHALSALKRLILPSSGRLQTLIMEPYGYNVLHGRCVCYLFSENSWFVLFSWGHA